MMKKTLFLLFVLAACLEFFGAPFVSAQAPSSQAVLSLIQQLQEQVLLLQRQIADLKARVESAQAPAAPAPGVPAQAPQATLLREAAPPPPSFTSIKKTLRRGDAGDDVRKLQEFLKTLPDIYPEGLVTGFFGPLTERATRRFHERQGLGSAGSAGPQTIARINEIMRERNDEFGPPAPAVIRQGETERRATASPEASLLPATSATTSPTGRITTQTTPTTTQAVFSSATSTQAAATSSVSTPLPSPTPISPETPLPAPITPSSSSQTASPSTAATSTADTTAPTILNVQATSTSPTAVVITWTTDEPSDSKVEYGGTIAYDAGQSVSDSAKVASHAVTLSKTFISNSTHHFRVISKDAAGNAATSPDNTFIVPAWDTAPPVISGLQAGDIAETSATISWTTDESALANIYYAAFSPIDASTATKLTTYAFFKSYNQGLVGLSAATTYYYIISVKDSSGNAATSSEQSFTTSSPPALPTPIGHWLFDGNGNNAVAGGVAAVATGGAQFKTEGGKFGGYAYLPANGDSIKIPYSSIFDLASSFTIEFWFRQRSNQSAAQDLVYKGTPINNYNFRVFRQLWNEFNFGPVITGYTAVNTGYWSQTSNLNQLSHGSWHHVAYTKSTSGSAYYLDGSLIHSLDTNQYPEYAGPAKTPAVDIIVGGSAIDTDIDNLRIYSTALTAGQVSQNMQTASVRPKAADAQLADIAAALTRIAEALKKLGVR